MYIRAYIKTHNFSSLFSMRPIGMMQLDMTGYIGKNSENVVGIVTGMMSFTCKCR